jgi:hypothetical protein
MRKYQTTYDQNVRSFSVEEYVRVFRTLPQPLLQRIQRAVAYEIWSGEELEYKRLQWLIAREKRLEAIGSPALYRPHLYKQRAATVEKLKKQQAIQKSVKDVLAGKKLFSFADVQRLEKLLTEILKNSHGEKLKKMIECQQAVRKLKSTFR